MITRLHIENFKSLVDFYLPDPNHKLGNFVCLIGMNGSGKSTVLQALDFLAQMFHGRMSEWCERRDWDPKDLASRIPMIQEWIVRDGRKILRPSRIPAMISFEVDFDFDGREVSWIGRFNRSTLRCTSEDIMVSGESKPIFTHSEGFLQVNPGKADHYTRETKGLIYEGSVLSVFEIEEELPKRIKALMMGLKSLELLAPQAMRRRSRKGEDIGYGGEKLAAFLDRIPQKEWEHLNETIRGFFPTLENLWVSNVRGGWKRVTSTEKHGVKCNITAAHMNDGTLRVLAILAQAYSTHPVLLFDEIENGINPEIVEKLVDFLVGMKKQVIVTTHSPMILNYLEDRVARESVFLLYRDDAGWTRATRFFDLPETNSKLRALGPGEVFVDTNLTLLTKRLAKKNAAFKPVKP